MGRGGGVVPRPSLSFFQSIIGVVAGLTSVTGGLYSAVRYWRPPLGAGEVIALVSDARDDRPVRGAAVEILTPEGSLVTTVAATEDGLARRSLKEGTYHLRVSHPQFKEEARDIRILPGNTSEVRLQLAARAEERPPRRSAGSSPTDGATRVVGRGVSATRRFLNRLGL
jgi:hypothetical protein